MPLQIVSQSILRQGSRCGVAALRSITSDVQSKRSRNKLPDHIVTKDRSVEIVDKKTHTHQIWDKDDYRLARFIDKQKEVNPNFAIDLIPQVPPKACKARVISCDGGDGALGHPRVFINLDQPGNHSCGYCGLRFYLEHDHHH